MCIRDSPGAYAKDRCFSIEPMALSPGRRFEWGGLELGCAKSDHPVRNSAVRIDEGKLSVCFSGDGAPTTATRALYRGASVLVHECYAADERVRGHATADEILKLGDECEVETLCLLHIARRQKARVAEIAAAHRGPSRVLIPNPGDRLPIVQRKEPDR